MCELPAAPHWKIRTKTVRKTFGTKQLRTGVFRRHSKTINNKLFGGEKFKYFLNNYRGKTHATLSICFSVRRYILSAQFPTTILLQRSLKCTRWEEEWKTLRVFSFDCIIRRLVWFFVSKRRNRMERRKKRYYSMRVSGACSANSQFFSIAQNARTIQIFHTLFLFFFSRNVKCKEKKYSSKTTSSAPWKKSTCSPRRVQRRPPVVSRNRLYRRPGMA